MSNLKRRNKKAKRTDLERIADWLNPDKKEPPLPKRLQEKYQVWHKINRLLMSNAPRHVAETIAEDYPKLSPATVWRYINDSRQLFNLISTARDPDFGARLTVEWAYEARSLAIQRKDARALVSLVRAMIEAFGLKEGMGQQIKPELLEQKTLIMQINIGTGTQKKTQTIDITNPEDLADQQREQLVEDVEEAAGFSDMESLLAKFREKHADR